MERAHHLAAELDETAVGERRLLHAPAGPVARLDDDDVRPAAGKVPRGGQAGQPCAHDHHIVLAHAGTLSQTGPRR